MVHRAIAIQSFLLMMGASVALAEGFSFPHQQPQRSHNIVTGTGSSIPSASMMKRRGSFHPRSPVTDSLAFVSAPRGGALHNYKIPRGGVRYAEPSDDDMGTSNGIVGKTISAFGSVWGSMGVVYILLKAVKRVLPIAMEPLKEGSTLAFSNIQWG